jgi:hypothetical protein
MSAYKMVSALEEHILDLLAATLKNTTIVDISLNDLEFLQDFEYPCR